jgi:protein-tyrosine phosphatase
MAEYLFRDLLDAPADWKIASAGTYTRNGLPTNREVLTVLESNGIDASGHRSMVITRKLLEEHNLVLCMANNHKEALRVEFPDLKDRIYLLSEMVGKMDDIEDPIGGPLIEYQETANEINQYLTDGFDRIIELAKEK